MKRSPPTVEHGQQIDYNFKLKSIEKFSNKCGNVERVRVLSKSATKNDALNAETKEKNYLFQCRSGCDKTPKGPECSMPLD